MRIRTPCFSLPPTTLAGLVNEVVVPLLSMSSSVLLCISTLLDGANHYSKMIALTGPDGKKVFESIAITLVCGKHLFQLSYFQRGFQIPGPPCPLLADACLKTEHPENCRHKMSEIPRWISSQKVEIVRTMLSDVRSLSFAFLRIRRYFTCYDYTRRTRQCFSVRV